MISRAIAILVLYSVVSPLISVSIESEFDLSLQVIHKIIVKREMLNFFIAMEYNYNSFVSFYMQHMQLLEISYNLYGFFFWKLTLLLFFNLFIYKGEH